MEDIFKNTCTIWKKIQESKLENIPLIPKKEEIFNWVIMFTREENEPRIFLIIDVDEDIYDPIYTLMDMKDYFLDYELKNQSHLIYYNKFEIEKKSVLLIKRGTCYKISTLIMENMFGQKTINLIKDYAEKKWLIHKIDFDKRLKNYYNFTQ
jgi:hypothetical protein